MTREERATTREEREAGYRETGLWTDDPIGNLVSSQAGRWPDRELFSFEDRRVSYGDFDAWVSTVAADLAGAGVRRGDRVMVMMPNCLEALVLQVAAFRIGAVDMPVIPIYREHEIRQILADSRPAAVAVGAELGSRRPAAELDTLLAELGQQPVVRYIVGAPRPGWRAVPASGTVRVRELPEPLAADQPALLLYTSGTTSAPKGVLLTSRALLAHLRNYQQALGASDKTVLLAGTPLSHLGGFISGVIFPAFLGARSVIMRSWQPDEAVPLIEREQVSLMMGAPVFLSDLVQRYEAGAAPAHRLSLFMCAGAAIHPATIERAQAVGVTAVRVYGMTETAGVCTMASAEDPVERRSRWDGHLIPGMEIEAADRERRRLAPGEEGELRIRGPQLLTGYTDPGLTQAQIDADGWFYPGDIGVVDAQGWVRMSGRSKDIINRGGEKFSAMDIEAAIAAHPDVADVSVTAVPDARLGEAAGAWLVLRHGAVWAGPAPIIEHLEQRKLARQKIPVQWHVVAAIPTTASGKVQKNRLAELEDVTR